MKEQKIHEQQQNPIESGMEIIASVMLSTSFKYVRTAKSLRGCCCRGCVYIAVAIASSSSLSQSTKFRQTNSV